ncbi:MAG: shikimate kinase [Planctomycetota bacterium]
MTPKTRASAQKESIALVGLRGCGKTTVGRILAGHLKLPHVDTDELVVAAAGRAIAEIFASEGEAGFRELEKKAVERAVALSPAVISLGGGALSDPSSAAMIRCAATVVWLTAEPDVLWQRIARDPSSPTRRPSLTPLPGLDELRRFSAQREPMYRALADFILDTQEKEPLAIAHDIAHFLEGIS